MSGFTRFERLLASCYENFFWHQCAVQHPYKAAERHWPHFKGILCGSYLLCRHEETKEANLLSAVKGVDVYPQNRPADGNDGGERARKPRDEARLEFHSDQGATDLIALLSITKAKEGGESKWVSSVAIHNELLRRGRKVKFWDCQCQNIGLVKTIYCLNTVKRRPTFIRDDRNPDLSINCWAINDSLMQGIRMSWRLKDCKQCIWLLLYMACFVLQEVTMKSG